MISITRNVYEKLIVMGIVDDEFILQGSLTIEQLFDLKKKIDEFLEANEERESYLSLADEMNDPDTQPFKASDWDAEAVKLGKKFAKRNGLRWPPRAGDFERFLDLERNGEESYA